MAEKNLTAAKGRKCATWMQLLTRSKVGDLAANPHTWEARHTWHGARMSGCSGDLDNPGQMKSRGDKERVLVLKGINEGPVEVQSGAENETCRAHKFERLFSPKISFQFGVGRLLVPIILFVITVQMRNRAQGTDRGPTEKSGNKSNRNRVICFLRCPPKNSSSGDLSSRGSEQARDPMQGSREPPAQGQPPARARPVKENPADHPKIPGAYLLLRVPPALGKRRWLPHGVRVLLVSEPIDARYILPGRETMLQFISQIDIWVTLVPALSLLPASRQTLRPNGTRLLQGRDGEYGPLASGGTSCSSLYHGRHLGMTNQTAQLDKGMSVSLSYWAT
ncbi:hypothetical protein Bbelb_169050 [Branchiostoma belcheri]|nr:hypothetical protein Bbelb_169050 [Branchiostoma belcheri]